MRSTRYLGTIPPATRSRGSRKPPSQPIPLGRLLMQQPPALAAFLKAHQAPLIGAGMEGDAPADPALEHIVENLGHGRSGGGPDPEAAPRKGWPESLAMRPTGQTGPVAASSWNPCAGAAAWRGPPTS